MSETARSSVLTGGFKIFWWSLMAGWLCLPLAFALLTLEKWTTGVDRSWAAMHGGHPVFVLIIPWMFAWLFSHPWLIGAGYTLWRAGRATKWDLVRYAVLLLPTAALDVVLMAGLHR